MVQIGSTKVIAGVRAILAAKESQEETANQATVEGMDMEVVLIY